MFYRIKEKKNNKFCCPKSIISFRPVNISYKDSGFVGYYTKYIHYNAFLRNSIMCSESYKEKYEAVPIVYSYLVFMLFYSPWIFFFDLSNNKTHSRGLGRVVSKKMRMGSQKLREAETPFTLGSGHSPHSWSNVLPQRRILILAYLNLCPVE